MSILRKDRFFYSTPIVSEEEFRRSNYLKWYDRTEPYPERSTVLRNLRELSDNKMNFSNICELIENTSDDFDIIRTYTSNIKVASHTFYTYINQQLSSDNEQVIEKLIPLIRRATAQINNNPPSNNPIVYRGIELNKTQRNYFKVNTIFRFAGFTSTSESRDSASKFGNTLFKIHIYRGCLQVKDMADISYYPEEKEFLFSPYSRFKVIQIQGQLITLQAMDNRTHFQNEQFNANIFKRFRRRYSSNCVLS